MRAVVAVPSALLVAVLLVAGCADGSPGVAGTTPPSATRPAAAPSNAASPTGTAGPFSGTDIAWLQLTVAMADRLLPVLDLVSARTTDPDWRRLATQIEATHRAYLGRSRQLLHEFGAPTTNPHEGHDMPGMITAEELAALRSATGTSFQRLLAGHLRAHLTQAARMATAEQRGGVHPATTTLAATVVRDGTTDLARLDRLDAQRPAGRRPQAA
ncbi:DUF305 domain-containing protein [Micromonospora sp. U21]|uniref:DUF305 domain-containing protein n=1 Tax=Micromonospora sp. U21 TaxID=2824899 RepID=UPI001B35A9F5|nr:DUF305 domain-containing protein [Micromonospora sp. U21]MBQ0905131.1 DUF305 domain-containing protein [Micromonospora sp. U21]